MNHLKTSKTAPPAKTTDRSPVPSTIDASVTDEPMGNLSDASTGFGRPNL